MFGQKALHLMGTLESPLQSEQQFRINIARGDNTEHLNKDAPNSFTVEVADASVVQLLSATNGKIASEGITLKFNILKEGQTNITVNCTLYICSDEGMCIMKKESFELIVKSSTASNNLSSYQHKLSIMSTSSSKDTNKKSNRKNSNNNNISSEYKHQKSYHPTTPISLLPSTVPFNSKATSNPFAVENKIREEKQRPVVLYRCGSCGMESPNFRACSSCQSKLMYKKRTPKFIHHDAQ
ncbi:hypothetical protein ABK040_007921 [Willaertia magna]